ncbi:sensor histidine kinase [Vallitalea okinawensis]|uniref:sensor histidine kinase n=1 Tax=Vallitalea okinawensis TaxID=2078660 RepID=UPI0014786574|nr:sensor histidine kinase [Vallitalea okinawensis]
MKIRTKIMMFYSVLIFVSLGISMIVYTHMSNNYAKEAIMDLNIQTIETQNKSLEVLINDISDYSKQLISNQHIQGVLDNIEDNQLVFNRLDKEIAASVIFNHKVSSAYIFDLKGNSYSKDNQKYKELTLADIRSQTWYEEVESLRGGYYININAGGLINDAETDYISMFRIINSNNDHQPIGILMVNIEVDTMKEILNIGVGTDFILVMDRGDYQEYLIIGEKDFLTFNPFINEVISEETLYIEEKIDGKSYRITGFHNAQYGWQLIHMKQADDQNELTENYNLVFLSILIIIGITIFYGSFYISKYISNPIVELTRIMEAVEAEKFDEIYMGSREDEIGRLGRGYNYMINRIKELIDEIIQEQETIKKAELRILMEQIKPHFIYNTLDSISLLVSKGYKEEAYDSLVALGKFYRASLSDGNTVIDLKTEFEIVKNYLFIQKIRYKDLFEVDYSLESQLENIKVPKLILQPLVENSLYHGIRPLGMEGYIEVAAYEEDNWIILMVKDNGQGMSEDKVRKIKNEQEGFEQHKESVGLPATIRRTRNMFGDKSYFDIDSDNQGTTIKIYIPKENGHD